MKTMKMLWVALIVLPSVAFSATDYSTDFEGSEFVVNQSVNGIDGWVDSTNDDIIRDASYDTWGTHGKYLTCWGTNALAYAPTLDTSAKSKVNISLDYRPADGTTGGNSGGYVGLYGSGTDDCGVTLIRFDSTGVDTGNIVATDGGDDNFITIGTWTFVDSNTNYHFDMVVDNVNKTTSVSIDGGNAVLLAWGGSWGSAVSSGTFEQLWFRGGLNETRAMTAIDDISIVSVPEPATLCLLLAGAGIAAFKRRKG